MENYLLLVCLFLSQNFFMHADHKPRVLLTYPWDLSITIGGGIMHTLHHAKMLQQHGYPTYIMTHKNSSMARWCENYEIPKVYFSSSDAQHDFAQACHELSIDVVITPEIRDVAALKKVKQLHPIKIIYVRHLTIDTFVQEQIKILSDIDAIIGVNPTITDYFRRARETHHLHVPFIEWIAPFWDEEHCTNVKKTTSRQDFFRTHFNVATHDGPLLCMVANMINTCKNYPLLLAALHALIYTKKRNVQAVLVGDGPLKPDYENLSHKLGLKSHVFFLGSTQKVPEILNFCDMHVLASNAEGFPIVNVEAAYLSKPIIAAQGTGAAHLIAHGKTGLLFKNNDLKDLVKNIEQFLNNPSFAHGCGQEACKYVHTHCTNQKLFEQWEKVFEQV